MPARHPPTHSVCLRCSKPIGSGSYVVLEHGELLHVRCQSRILEAEAMEAVALAKLAQEREAHLMQQNLALRRECWQDLCPVCGEPASILDWRPSGSWLAVDDCKCDGFFLWTGLPETRLRGLPIEDRVILSARIRSVRKTGREAWLLTDDETPGGVLTIRDERPDHMA